MRIGKLGAATAALAATAAMCAVPTGASATTFQSFYSYTVAFNGSGSYTSTDTDANGPNNTVDEITKKTANFRWSTLVKDVLIPVVASNPLITSGFPAYGLGQDISGDWSIDVTSPDGSNQPCDDNGTFGDAPEGDDGSVSVHRPASGPHGVIFDVSGPTANTESGGGSCDYSTDPFETDFIEWAQGETGNDTPVLGANILLTTADLKHSSVTKQVDINAKQKLPTDCGSGDNVTCTASFTWKGSVKFTKHKFA